jgi:parvulin-like peptidyl-prolyl isomerase
MSRRRLARFVALAVVLAIALLSSACSDTLNDAATVDDTHIRREDFNAELEDLLSNDQFVELLEQNQFQIDDGGETADAQLAATWLSLLVQQVAIDAEFDDRGLELTDEIRAAGRSEVNRNFGGAEVVDRFPGDFIDKLVERQARLVAVSQDVAGDPIRPPSVEDARAFYDENRDALFACPSAKRVSHIVLATEAEANDVLAQLQGGAEFAALAQERSNDPQSAQTGGVIPNPQGPQGCYPTGESPERDAAVDAAPTGEPTGPVQTGAGFEVLLADDYVPPSFEEVQDELIAQLQQQAQQSAQTRQQAALNQLLEERLRALDVRVDPRYGEWVVDDQGARVEPPAGPDVRGTRTPEVTPPTIDPFGGVTGP